MIVAFVIGMSVVLIVFSAAIVSMPRWCARSLHRHRMWALRDALIDDILAGRLAGKDEAVQELRQVMEFIIHDHHLSTIDLRVFAWAERKASPATRKALKENAQWSSIDGLPLETKILIKHYREKFEVLTVGLFMLGSWTGLLAILGSIPKAIGRHRPIFNFRVVVRVATDQAVVSSKLGKEYREALENKSFLPGTRELASSARMPCR